MNAHAYEMPTWLIIMVCTVIYHPSSLGHSCLLLFLLQLSEDNLAVVTQLCSRLCWLGESDVIDWGLCCRQTWRENHWCLSCWRPSTQTHVFQDVVVTTMLLKESDWADAVFFFVFVFGFFFGLIVLHSWGFLRDIYSLLSQPCVVVYCLRWICSVYSVLWCMLSACLLLQTWRVTSSTTCDSQGQDAYSTEPTGTPPTISCITMMTSTWKSSVYDHNEGLICIL